jgi:hypothetical protein
LQIASARIIKAFIAIPGSIEAFRSRFAAAVPLYVLPTASRKRKSPTAAGGLPGCTHHVFRDMHPQFIECQLVFFAQCPAEPAQFGTFFV